MNLFEQSLNVYFTDNQLNLIQKANIGIGGAGGLGSNCAMILVRSGVKQIEILDHDIIEASNLNRQQYFINEIGKFKVEMTKKRLLAINPDLNITIHQTKWTKETGDQFFNKCPIIIEAFDNAEFKHQFVDYYHDKTELIVSGNGMAGLKEKKPLIKRKIGNIYLLGDNSTDTANGHPPLAPRVTQCAAMMSEVVLDKILGLDMSCN